MATENLHLSELKKKFIEKIIKDYGKKYPNIIHRNYKDTNLSALIKEILEDTKKRFSKDNTIKDFFVSEPTLRRIFDDETKPTTFKVPTRNFMSYYLGYLDFNDFINNYQTKSTLIETSNELIKDESDATIIPEIAKPNKLAPIQKLLIFLGAFLIIFLLFFSLYDSNKSNVRIGKFKKTHYESKTAPITIKFEYELSDNDFKNAYLDYKMKNMTYEGDTTVLEKGRDNVSVCFLHPTIRTVRLISDNQKLDSTKVIIPSDGWVAGYSAIHYLHKSLWQKNGIAHINKQDIIESVRNQPSYYSFIKKVGNFSNCNADNLILETRLKNPTAEGGISCNDATVTIVGSENEINLNLTNSGCSYFSYLNLPNKKIQGSTHDLSNLAINLDNFVNLKIELTQNIISIFIENKLVYKTTYDKNLGTTEAIHIGFQGVGSVDFIKLFDFSSKKIIENEDF